MSAGSAEWSRVLRALAALAVDGTGLKGMTLRVRAGPVRRVLDGMLDRLPGPVVRIHPNLDDTQLFGGLNVAASLAQGRSIRDGGLADRPALLVLTMAERTAPGLAARLAHLLDRDEGHRLILLDEGADADEAAPAALRERLAFAADLHAVRHDEARPLLPAPGDLDRARALLPRVATRPDDAAALTLLAARFGIDSPRAPLFAWRAARVFAAIDGRSGIEDGDLGAAAELVYSHRATILPDEPEADAEASEPAPHPEAATRTDEARDLPDDMMVSAVRARIPADILARLQEEGRGAAVRTASGSGAGARHKGNRRGRPLPSRPGRPDGRARIDVIATLRAAAPWQTIRKGARADAPRVVVHPGDIRLGRYEDRSDRLIVFVVDASGSAAVTRLAEAKGAVELLLAQAYSRRDHVALIGFRGRSAEVLLQPTRALVQAKRRLAGLAGGGGTPLAAGLRQALAVAAQARTHGLSPALAVLTDAKANVALDGTGSRDRAGAEARQLAGLIAAAGVPGVVIDIAPRPAPEAADLAEALGARHLPLPRADAARISRAVMAELSD